MITIQHIQKSFGKLQVLRGISMQFETPGITAILGPNGSGKTTLIKAILGMVLPDKGDILFQGQSIRNKWAYRSAIDYLPQIAQFPQNLKVRELFRLVRDLRGIPARQEALVHRFGLEPFLEKRLGTLSGGTRQKVNLVQCLMYDSPVLVLDEPTSGLDPIALIELKALLKEEREKGKLILITSHIMSFVEEMADEIVFLLDGHIHFRGSKAQIKTQFGATNLEQAIANILKKNKNKIKSSMNGVARENVKIQLEPTQK